MKTVPKNCTQTNDWNEYAWSLTFFPYQEHSYALDPSPNRVKDRLAQALANMERLQRQLRNAKDRERRCKTTLKSALDDLKERNLITDELHQRLDMYSSL